CLLTSLLVSSSRDLPALHSFPTRRSSDLGRDDARRPMQRQALHAAPARAHSSGTHRPDGDHQPPALARRSAGGVPLVRGQEGRVDRKSTRLNSSHVKISYAVFCLKKKK